MSKDVSKTKVGIFVVGGILLLLVGIVTLSDKSLFTDDLEYVLYFDGSVSGLSIGAPVVFRGVPLGSVTQISLVTNPHDDAITIPVTIRINASKFVRVHSDTSMTNSMRAEFIRRMVQRGLRARLQLQSLITGQYRIELDFFSDVPAQYHSTNHATEIPTTPSTLDAFQRTLARLPLENMAQSLNNALDGIAKLANDKNLYKAIAAVRTTFENTAELTQGAQGIRDDLQRTLNAIGDTSVTLDNQLPEAMGAFQMAMHGFSAAVKELENVLTSTNRIVSRDSRTMREIHQALKEFTEMSRSFRELANMLEQQPESLVFGKGGHR